MKHAPAVQLREAELVAGGTSVTARVLAEFVDEGLPAAVAVVSAGFRAPRRRTR
jgi:hypothetical protein